MEKQDIEYMSGLLVDSERITTLLMGQNNNALADACQEYHAWAREQKTDDLIACAIMCVMTTLGKLNMMGQLRDGLKVSDHVIQALSSQCVRFDVGPYRVPHPMVRFMSVDALHASEVIDAISNSKFNMADRLLRRIFMGSLPQTLFVLHNIVMHVSFQPSTIPQLSIEMRATSLRTSSLVVKEKLGSKPWCGDCAVHALDIMATMEDRNERTIRQEQPEQVSDDTKAIEEMKQWFNL